MGGSDFLMIGDLGAPRKWLPQSAVIFGAIGIYRLPLFACRLPFFFWNFPPRPRESTVSAGCLPGKVSEQRMSGSQRESDAELLRLMLAGDESAFTALYRRRQGGVYRFALQMSGSEALAEDVVQETFMVLMREGRNFDPARGSLAAYLYGIARNHVLRAFDRERALVRFDDEAEEGGEPPHENLVARPDPLGDLTRATRFSCGSSPP